MYRFFAGTALAAIGLGLALVGAGPAAQNSKVEAPKVEKKATPAIPLGGVNDDGLGELLNKLGYQPKKVVGKDAVTYEVRFQRDGWDQVFHCGISPDRKMVIVFVPLLKLPEGDKLRPDILEKILRKNQELSPTNFVCNENRLLYLVHYVSNRNLTTARVRQELDWLTSTVTATHSLWNPARYEPIQSTPVHNANSK